MSALISIGALIIVLGVLIFVHELGHFLAAKAAGIHVHRFSLGLGSPIKALSFSWRGTEYAISWLPLGGYVKMATQEEEATSSALEGETPVDPVPPDQYFEAKPVWARMIVILAGVTMNALFAWLVYAGLVAANGVDVTPETKVGIVADELPAGAEALASMEPGDSIVAVGGVPVATWEQVADRIKFTPADTVLIELAGKPPVVLQIHPDALEERILASASVIYWLPPVLEEISEDSPAAAAGFAPGDTILAIDSSRTPQWYDVREIVSANPGRQLAFEVGRASGRLILAAAPDAITDSLSTGEVQTRGQLGIVVRTVSQRQDVALGQALARGARLTADNSTLVVRSVRGLLTSRVDRSDLGGPILIGQLAGQTAQLGLAEFLAFMAFISINLAVLNMLPIPVLDGGQFLFLVAEAVLRRPLSLKLRERLTALGLVLIVLLMGLAFWNDLSRLLVGLLG